MNGAAAVAGILQREGVERFFCFPDNKLIDPVASLGIRPIMARSERAAVSIADGYSRTMNGRQLGVVIVQFGPGIENSFGGIAQAFSDSSPILVLCGQLDQGRLAQEPNFDAVASYREITKWAVRVNRPERVPELLRRAFTFLRAGRPGPVLLELPDDVLEAEVDERALLRYAPVPRLRSAADAAAVEAAVETLLAASRPLLYAGHGVLYAEACDELLELAELLGLPVMTSLAGKSAFPENHPLSVGTGGRTAPLTAARFLERADVVFGIGASFTLSLYGAPMPDGARLIQVTVDERDVNKDYRVEHALLGDAKLVLRQVIEEVRRQASRPRPTARPVAEEIAAVREEDILAWMPRLTSDETPMNPYRVIWEVMQALEGEDTVVTHDSGSPRDELSPFWRSVAPRSYLGWGKSTHLGFGYGLAMGAKLAAPEKLVVNFMGDAAFGMVGMEVETAARLHIPVLTILLNNSAMANYEQRYPVATERYGFKYLTGDYTAVARALGAYGERVDEPGDIPPALGRARQALADGRPALLEMITRDEPALSKYW